MSAIVSVGAVGWLACVAAALLGSVLTFWGLGGLVHHHYYVRRRAGAESWKLQPRRWLTPALGRHAFWLGSANLLLGSLMAGTFICYLRGGGASALYHGAPHGLLGWLWLPVSAVLALAMMDAGLYYSHRAFHDKRLFRYIHRWHHRYVAPTIFTTTAMHPVEFVVFAATLVLPALVLPMHVGVYIVVIAYTYLVGMIDHSGIRATWHLPFHDDNRFHDDHHVYFHCNYGHHTALWDRLHGTVRRPDRRYDEHTWGEPTTPATTTAEAEEPHVRLSRAQ